MASHPARARAFRTDPRAFAEEHRGNRAKEAWGRAARRVVEATGSVWAFGVAAAVIVVWVVTGPIFGFSDTWQLIINTGTTIVTFLMVFLIQHAQNRDTLAMQAKLNELIAAMKGASNQMIDVEDLSEDELEGIEREYRDLVARVGKDDLSSRSVAEVKGHGDPEARPRSMDKPGGGSGRVA